MKNLYPRLGMGACILCALMIVLFVKTEQQDTYVADEQEASKANTSEDIIFHEIACHEISGIELLDIIAVKFHNMNLPIKIKVLGKGETKGVQYWKS